MEHWLTKRDRARLERRQRMIDWCLIVLMLTSVIWLIHVLSGCVRIEKGAVQVGPATWPAWIEGKTGENHVTASNPSDAQREENIDRGDRPVSPGFGWEFGRLAP